MTDIIAISGLETAGEITYCRLSGDVDLQKLHETWLNHGLPEDLLPSPPTEEFALQRVLEEMKSGYRVLLRKLAGKSGFALVHEEATDEELTYNTSNMLKARIRRQEITDQQGNKTIQPVVQVAPKDHPQAEQIREQFEKYRNTMASRVFGGRWLWGRLAGTCKAVSLRESGGIYFIPRDQVDTWHRYCEAIHEACAGIKIFRIPAVEEEDAVDAVLAAIKAEAEVAVAAIEEEINREGDNALGLRALQTRQRRAQEVRSKVAHYESLFSRQLPELQRHIDDLDTEITGAILMCEPDDNN